MLESVDEGIANAYMLKTGRSKEELMAHMDKETFFNAQKAVELGLADEIMFSESDNGPEISNNASAFVELPQSVIDKVRSELLKNQAHTDPEAKAEDETVMHHLRTNQNEGEDTVKDLAELQAKYPDIYNAAVAAGEQQERTRITELQALADAPGAAEIVQNAIKNGGTAAQAAMDIVKASKERVNTAGQQRQADSQASGAHEVPADEAPAAAETSQAKAKAEADKEADALAAEIKNQLEQKGGRKHA